MGDGGPCVGSGPIIHRYSSAAPYTSIPLGEKFLSRIPRLKTNAQKSSHWPNGEGFSVAGEPRINSEDLSEMRSVVTTVTISTRSPKITDSSIAIFFEDSFAGDEQDSCEIDGVTDESFLISPVNRLVSSVRSSEYGNQRSDGSSRSSSSSSGYSSCSSTSSTEFSEFSVPSQDCNANPSARENDDSSPISSDQKSASSTPISRLADPNLKSSKHLAQSARVTLAPESDSLRCQLSQAIDGDSSEAMAKALVSHSAQEIDASEDIMPTHTVQPMLVVSDGNFTAASQTSNTENSETNVDLTGFDIGVQSRPSITVTHCSQFKSLLCGIADHDTDHDTDFDTDHDTNHDSSDLCVVLRAPKRLSISIDRVPSNYHLPSQTIRQMPVYHVPHCSPQPYQVLGPKSFGEASVVADHTEPPPSPVREEVHFIQNLFSKDKNACSSLPLLNVDEAVVSPGRSSRAFSNENLSYNCKEPLERSTGRWLNTDKNSTYVNKQKVSRSPGYERNAVHEANLAFYFNRYVKKSPSQFTSEFTDNGSDISSRKNPTNPVSSCIDISSQSTVEKVIKSNHDKSCSSQFYTGLGGSEVICDSVGPTVSEDCLPKDPRPMLPVRSFPSICERRKCRTHSLPDSASGSSDSSTQFTHNNSRNLREHTLKTRNSGLQNKLKNFVSVSKNILTKPKKTDAKEDQHIFSDQSFQSCEDHKFPDKIQTTVKPVYEGDEENEEYERAKNDLHASESAVTSESGPQELKMSVGLMQKTLASGQLVGNFESRYRRNRDLSISVARLSINENRNRYRDISPYDATRVFLQDEPDLPDGGSPFNDYINASHVEMKVPVSNITNRYIASQGPLNSTCLHFWLMVWQQDCRLLVMLTTCVEQGRTKCHQYWPELGGTTEYGPLSVTCSDQTSQDAFILRKFTVKHKPSSKERTIHHLQYVTWPDHGVPEHSTDFLTFVKEVRRIRAESFETENPVLVHCSAGIGRTGVLILMETAQCLIEANQPIYPGELVQKMRDQRPMMIQTSGQFRFVCEAILRVYNEGLIKPLPEEYFSR